MDCSKITVGFTQDACTGASIPGTAGRVLLMSYSDIDRALSTVSDTDPNVLDALVLKTGAKAYQVDSLPNAVTGEDTINKGTYMSTHQQNLTVRIFKKSEAAKKFVNQLTSARVVAIVENNERGDAGEVKYEVYGWDAGLELNELTASTEMADQVVYTVVLGSGTVSQETSLPKSLYAGSETATDALITSLLTPAAGG